MQTLRLGIASGCVPSLFQSHGCRGVIIWGDRLELLLRHRAGIDVDLPTVARCGGPLHPAFDR